MGRLRSALKSLRLSGRSSRRGPKRNRPLWVEDLEGRPLLSLTGAISLAPMVGASSNMITGPDGNLWVAGPGVHSSLIERIGRNGSVAAFAVPGAPEVDSLAPGPDGNVWFAAQSRQPNTLVSHGILGKVTPGGRITEFRFAGNLGVLLTGTDAIARGPRGVLWFAFQGQGPGDVSEFGRITGDGRVKRFPVSFSQIEVLGIVAGPDGNLWFNNLVDGSVGRITPSGALTEFADVQPTNIANGLDGTLLVTGENAAGHFEAAQLSTTGATSFYNIPAALSQAFASYLGPAGGSLWFTNLDQNGNTTELGRITVTGAFKTYNLTPYIGTGVHFLFSIAFGKDGNLYLLDGKNPVVYRLAPSELQTQ